MLEVAVDLDEDGAALGRAIEIMHLNPVAAVP